MHAGLDFLSASRLTLKIVIDNARRALVTCFDPSAPLQAPFKSQSGRFQPKGANGAWPHQSQSADRLTAEVLFLVVRSSRAVRTRQFPDLLHGTSNMPVPTRVHFRRIQLSYGTPLWRNCLLHRLTSGQTAPFRN